METWLISLYWIMACTVSIELLVKVLAVSAGDNLLLSLPDGEAELKASVEPAPPAGRSLVFLGDSEIGRAGPLSPRAGLHRSWARCLFSHNVPQ